MAKTLTPAPTMRTIAQMAGISPTVVSHVLNRTPGAQVASETRQAIERIARETGYQKSLLSRSIKNPLRHLGIAVGGPDPTDHTYTDEIFDGIRQEATAKGYYPVIQAMPTDKGQTDCSIAVERMTELHHAKLIDGFIIDKQFFSTDSISQLHNRQVPIVTINGSPSAKTKTGSPVPSVVIDDRHGIQLGIEHLASLGHRRIGMMVRPYTDYPKEYAPFRVWQQILGYHDALAEAGLAQDARLLVEGDPFDKQRTYQAVAQLLEHSAPPTAILVGDDMMALMVLRALEKRGLSVPADMSVVGYGDWSVATRLADPELTTVHTPLVENGRQAARMMITLLEASELTQPTMVLSPNMIVRDSTAGPANV